MSCEIATEICRIRHVKLSGYDERTGHILLSITVERNSQAAEMSPRINPTAGSVSEQSEIPRKFTGCSNSLRKGQRGREGERESED